MTNLSPYIRPVKAKVKKPKSKGTKAASVEKVTVDQLIFQLGDTSFILEQQPYHSLLQIYKKQFLDVSVSKGLINANSLSVAGDGTLLLPLTELEVTIFVTVPKRGFQNATVTDTFPSRTVISDGILPETAGTMDTIYICWLHPTPMPMMQCPYMNTANVKTSYLSST